jgi:hypothetical protein
MVTEAQAITQFKDVIRIFKNAKNYTNVNGSNLAADLDTLRADLQGEDVMDLEASVAGVRSQAGWWSERGLGPNFALQALRTWARVVSTEVPKLDQAAILAAIYARMMVSADRIASRVFTRGTPSYVAGPGGTANGSLLRLNTDERNMPIENSFTEQKVLRCINDQNTGVQKHAEVFQMSGATPTRDAVPVIGGSGVGTTLTAFHAGNSFLTNASFSQFGGTTASPTSITGWTPTTSINNFAMDQANFYRGFPGDTTPTSVKIKANDTLTQLISARNTNLFQKSNSPLYLQVAWNRAVNGCDGTLTITMGSQTVNVVMAAQTGWNILKIPLDQNSWYRNNLAQDYPIKIALSGSTTFGLLVDDVIFGPMTQIDGGWWFLVGGSTPFLKDDVFNITDTATESVIQNFLWRFFGAYLPSSTAGGITIADP